MITETKKYIKIIREGIAYYLYEDHINAIRPEVETSLLQVAQFAVDIQFNKMLKCRDSLETIMNHHTGVLSR